MTVRKIKIKGEQVSFLAHADSAEKLLTGATTGATPTGWNLKVKGTYLHWVDDDGAERRKEGTLTGNSLAAGVIHVKGETIIYGDKSGGERSLSSVSGTISAVIDTLEFDTNVGQSPHIIHISGNIFAVAYSGPGSDGWLCTFSVGTDGAIGAAVIDTLEFDTADCYAPKIIHVSGQIYAIAYETTSAIKIVTVDIDSAGNIGAAVIDSFTTADTGSNVQGASIVHVSGDIFAVAYQDNDFDGKVITIDIDTSGNIGASEIDTYEFDTTQGGRPHIINISGTTYAIAYSGPSNDGFLITFAIATDGTITKSIIDTLEFDPSFGTSPRIINVSGDIYAIVYRGVGNDGFCKTMDIDSAGSISAVVDTLEFEAGNCVDPWIVNVGSTVFAIVYQQNLGGGDINGILKTLTIQSDGTLGAVIDTLEFDATLMGEYPSAIIHPDASGIIAIAYEGVDNDGFVKTVEVT